MKGVIHQVYNASLLSVIDGYIPWRRIAVTWTQMLYQAFILQYLVFRNTREYANADALSHLPLPDQPAKTQQEPDLKSIHLPVGNLL
jgi:hypothetical protein